MDKIKAYYQLCSIDGSTLPLINNIEEHAIKIFFPIADKNRYFAIDDKGIFKIKEQIIGAGDKKKHKIIVV